MTCLRIFGNNVSLTKSVNKMGSTWKDRLTTEKSSTIRSDLIRSQVCECEITTSTCRTSVHMYGPSARCYLLRNVSSGLNRERAEDFIISN